MEKLIYVLERRSGLSQDQFGEALLDLIEEIQANGAYDITVNVADMNDQVKTPKTTTSRIHGSWSTVAGAVHFWLDNLDTRGGIETALSKLCPRHHGYLVTESVVLSCPRTWNGRMRRPGATHFAMAMKIPSQSEDEYYRLWQTEYSQLSFQLHPLRRSYVRNAPVRVLTPDSPRWWSIVLEHFHELEDYTDNNRWFASEQLAERIVGLSTEFIDFSVMCIGPMSEYHFD